MTEIPRILVEDAITSSGYSCAIEIEDDYPWDGTADHCFGIVCDSDYQMVNFFIALAELEMMEPDSSEVKWARKLGNSMASNSMGRRRIIYYFPGVTIK